MRMLREYQKVIDKFVSLSGVYTKTVFTFPDKTVVTTIIPSNNRNSRCHSFEKHDSKTFSKHSGRAKDIGARVIEWSHTIWYSTFEMHISNSLSYNLILKVISLGSI